MKFLLFNVNDTNKNIINRIGIGNDCYINEVSISNKQLDILNSVNNNLFKKIRLKILDRNIEKLILKVLDTWDKKWYYIGSKTVNQNKYICTKIQSLLGSRVVETDELESNISKYVDEYINKVENQKSYKIKKHEIKFIYIAKYNKNLNFNTIIELLKEYKLVNIYLEEQPSEYTLKKIKQINIEEGTTIEIIKKDKKSLQEYNVGYFVDDFKTSFPRLRFNKNALLLDIEYKNNDKFNSNMIYINEYIDKNSMYKDNIQNLMNIYGNTTIATAIRKITNKLDKTRNLI